MKTAVNGIGLKKKKTKKKKRQNLVCKTLGEEGERRMKYRPHYGVEMALERELAEKRPNKRRGQNGKKETREPFK